MSGAVCPILKRCRIVIAVGMALSLCPLQRSQSQQPPPSTASEVVEGWKKYLARFQHASGSYASTGRYRHGNSAWVDSNGSGTFAFTNRCVRFEMNEKGLNWGERVYCYNSQYAFRLNKSQNGWLLHEVHMLGDERAGAIVNMAKSGLGRAHSLIEADGVSLIDMADRLNFNPHRNAATLADEYSVSSGAHTQHSLKFKTLTLEMAPDPFRTLKSLKGELTLNKSSGTIEIENEAVMVNGLPVPTRVKSAEVYEAGSSRAVELMNETTLTIDPSIELPESEFTLSAFGLPEPHGITWEKPTPRYVWCLLAASVSSAIAIALGYVLRRNAATKT